MQKKLLLISMVVSCGMLQADGLSDVLHGESQSTGSIKEEVSAELSQELTDYENQKNLLHKTCLIADELADYENQKIILFKSALFKALYEDSKAIDELAVENEKEYKQEEESSKNLQDDSSLGWCGRPATIKTINGRIGNYIGERKARKATINAELKKTFNGHLNTFNTLLTSVLQEEVVHANYEMEKTFFRALERCGDDKECLLDYNVHWPVKEDHLNRLISVAVKSVIKIVRENNIPLTDDQVEMTARKKVFEKGERLLSLESAEESKKKVLAKLNDILNPKKKDEQSLLFGRDVIEDQNDQGALSQ